MNKVNRLFLWICGLVLFAVILSAIYNHFPIK